jgi:hypothetical protein
MRSTSSVADQTLNVEGFWVLFLNQHDGGAEKWRIDEYDCAQVGTVGPRRTGGARPTDAREGRHR